MAIGVLALLTVVGCANPADNKPEAEVAPAVPVEEPSPAGARFVITDQSSINFVGSKPTASESGGFALIEGGIVLVNNDPTQSSVRVTIHTTSLWTEKPKLTNHLKSPDFFDVRQYPVASFTSTEIAGDGEGYRLTGNLELHGVTKSITFPATIGVEPDRVTARAEFVINRFDFGIAYPGRADDLIRDEVVINLNLVAAPA